MFNYKKFAKDVSLFLDIEPYKIKFEDLGESKYKFYLHDKYISINKDLKKEDLELMKIITHEYRKIFQMKERIKNANGKLYDKSKEYKEWVSDNRIKKELRYDQADLDQNAFSRYYLKRFKELDIDFDFKEYLNIVDEFIKNNIYRFELDKVKMEEELIKSKDL